MNSDGAVVARKRSLRVKGRLLVQWVGSLELTTIVLLYLFVLVLHGTLYQLDHSIQETTERYFDAWLLFVGPVPVPAGQLIFAVAGVNLLAATFTRISLRWDQIGLFLVHGGLLLLIAGGIVGRLPFRESVVALAEGESAEYSYDLRRWDLVLSDESGETIDRFALENLPEQIAGHDLRAIKYLPNAAVRELGPGSVESVSGAQSIERPEARREEHIPGLVAAIDDRRILLHGGDLRAFALNESVNLRLLPRRYPLPATIRLRSFHAEFHEGTRVPRSFASDVEVIQDGVVRPARISMNQPLRIGEFTVYQSGYDTQDGLPSVSFLQVVRNPYRQLPYIVGLMISAGLVFHAAVKVVPAGKRRSG